MRWFALTLLLFIAASCGPQGAADSQESPLYDLKVGEHPLKVERAVTPEEHARGLMLRKDMPENHGMLFVFEKPRQASFWMKNTLIPLSIAYLDAEGVILEIYGMTPLDKIGITSRSHKVAYALEVNQGWFEKRNIQQGTKVSPLP